MTTISTAEFKKGIYIEFHGEPHQIVSYTFTSPGKGSAFYKVKLRSLSTRRIVEFTFKSGEKVEEVYVETKELQYLYNDGEKICTFMHPRTFEQYEVPMSVLGTDLDYLVEGASCRVQFYEGEVVGVKLPNKVILEVIETEMAVKGDTVTGAMKEAVMNSGARVQVPLFVKKGDLVIVSPETGGYLSRG
jgi:elongation factor P